MAEIELTDEVIRQAMQRAERAVCPPADQRCSGFPWGVREALASRTPAGWCRIGWVAAESGRRTCDDWLIPKTGEGRLRRHYEEGPIRTSRHELPKVSADPRPADSIRSRSAPTSRNPVRAERYLYLTHQPVDGSHVVPAGQQTAHPVVSPTHR
jgi:hypothetical protein